MSVATKFDKKVRKLSLTPPAPQEYMYVATFFEKICIHLHKFSTVFFGLELTLPPTHTHTFIQIFIHLLSRRVVSRRARRVDELEVAVFGGTTAEYAECYASKLTSCHFQKFKTNKPSPQINVQWDQFQALQSTY